MKFERLKKYFVYREHGNEQTRSNFLETHQHLQATYQGWRTLASLVCRQIANNATRNSRVGTHSLCFSGVHGVEPRPCQQLQSHLHSRVHRNKSKDYESGIFQHRPVMLPPPFPRTVPGGSKIKFHLYHEPFVRVLHGAAPLVR